MTESRSVVTWGWGWGEVGRNRSEELHISTRKHFSGDEKIHYFDRGDGITGVCTANLIKLHTSKYMQFIPRKLYLNFQKMLLWKKITIPLAPSSPPSLLTLSKWNTLNSVVYTYCLRFLCIFSMLRLHHLRIHSRKAPRSSHLTNLKVSPWFSAALVMKPFSWHRLLTSVIY